jgi:hypothetical protein
MVIIVILQVGRNEIGGPQFCPLVHPKTSTGGVTQALNYVGNSRLQNGTSRVARDRFQGQAMVFIACPMNRWSITLEVRFQFAQFSRIWETGRAYALCATEYRSTLRWDLLRQEMSSMELSFSSSPAELVSTASMFALSPPAARTGSALSADKIQITPAQGRAADGTPLPRNDGTALDHHRTNMRQIDDGSRTNNARLFRHPILFIS